MKNAFVACIGIDLAGLSPGCSVRSRKRFATWG